MSLDLRFRPRPDAFNRLLDQIAIESPPTIQVVAGDEKLRPRWTDPPRAPLPGTTTVSALYAENLPPGAPETTPAHEHDLDFAARAAEIRAELRQTIGIDGLRRLRRRCALLAHPDRTPGPDRARAEAFMAEINAAIDAAIRDHGGSRPKA
jgi:hypothetical protein